VANTLTYKGSGVDVEKARGLVKDIGALRKRTEGKRQLLQAFGLFSASFELSGYRAPVILAACDGVGTKIRPLIDHDQFETAGVDLVAMNVNDILTSNAMPILFLDYIGIARINETWIKRTIAGMAEALEQCDCILAGGETAEMPDLVDPGLIELSGFCVGAAEKEDLLDPASIRDGDVVLGVPSNGFHANGWSLVRKILEQRKDEFSKEEIKTLLAPTRIYYPEVTALNKAGVPVKGMAHITGGGIRENLERVLGERGAQLQLPAWENEPVRKVLSSITPEEAVHTFNMGIGWMIITAPEHADAARAALPEASVLGNVGKKDLSIEVKA
jgi:phosphoribosylformylglycinamidine cyclo-ligase